MKICYYLGTTEIAPPDEKQATAALSFGYVVAYADTSNVLSRLEVHIMHKMVPMLNTKNPSLRINLVRSIDLMAKAFFKQRLPEGKPNMITPRDNPLMTPYDNPPTLYLLTSPHG